MAIQRNVGFENGDARNADGVALGVPLRREAAGALDALNFFYRKQFGRDLRVLEGHRSLAEQRRLYDGWQRKLPGYNLAAVPGTSNHGWGLAVDFGSPLHLSGSAEHQWMRETAPLFGWWWAGGDFGEPWHFEYDGRNVDEEQRADYLRRGIEDDGFTDADRALLDALAAGSLPFANGYPFPARDAVQNNLEAIAASLRSLALARGIDSAALAAAISSALARTLEGLTGDGVAPAEVADELARRLTEGGSDEGH